MADTTTPVTPPSQAKSKFLSSPDGSIVIWGALNGLDVPSVPSQFMTNLAYSAQTSGTAYIDALNKAVSRDPEQRDYVRVALSPDEDGIREAAMRLNRARVTDGQKPLSDREIDHLVDQASKFHLERETVFNNGFTVDTTNMDGLDSKPAWIAAARPEGNYDNSIWVATHLMPTDKFLKELEAANAGRATPTHELGHAILGQSERGADSMQLLRVANGEENMADKLATLAAYRDLKFDGDPDHTAGADVLLRMRNDLIKNPAEIHALIDGKTPTQIAAIAEQRYVTPSEEAYHNKAAIEEATAFAKGKIRHGQSSLLFGDPPIPRNMMRDGAVTLLRLEMETAKHMDVGPDNGLAKAMPEVWKANPQAFADAQKYMHDNYGIDVKSPLPPAPKPATQTFKAPRL